MAGADERLSSLTLAVAWRNGKTVHARKLNTGGELDEFLRAIVDETNASLSKSSIEDYRPDGGDPEEGRVYSAVRSDRIDNALIHGLSLGEDLDLANQAELRKRQLACYAIVTGAGDEQRLYVRRQDPVKLARKRLFTSLMAGPLTELESPVLAFDNVVDVVVEQDRILVMNSKGFESLFRDSELVLEAVPKWVDELRRHIQFSDESHEALLNSVRGNGIHRRKLLAILDSKYASTLTPKRIRKRMKQHGLDHEVLLPEDSLQLDHASVGPVLKLLNEDLYRGDFSKEHFAANGKRPFVT